MDYNEAKYILVGYASASDSKLPECVQKAIQTISLTNIDDKSSRIEGLSLLSDKAFVRSIIETLQGLSPEEQINYFRNLFYKESSDTIEGILANAINSFVTPMLNENVRLKNNHTEAIKLAYKYGQTEGADHKMWVINRMFETLIDDEFDYNEYLSCYRADTGKGWKSGVAPLEYNKYTKETVGTIISSILDKSSTVVFELKSHEKIKICNKDNPIYSCREDYIEINTDNGPEIMIEYSSIDNIL